MVYAEKKDIYLHVSATETIEIPSKSQKPWAHAYTIRGFLRRDMVELKCDFDYGKTIINNFSCEMAPNILKTEANAQIVRFLSFPLCAFG